MTYAKKCGKYGIYTDGILFKWFKDDDKALDFWKNKIAFSPEVIEQWLNEYDSVKLVNLETGEVIAEI